jgi:methyl acetate hydrolase
MFDPGTRWQYGANIDWVGRIVEAVSGERLDVYFHKHILGPLGMADTGFVVSPAQRARRANAHLRKPDGSLAPQPLEKQTTPTTFSGGGGIYSSAPDYLTLIRMLLQGGQFNGARILRAETVALMGQNQIGNIEAGILKTTNPALSIDVDFFPRIPLRWGLGHMINMEPGPNGRSAGSLTWAGLLNTYYWIDPDGGHRPHRGEIGGQEVRSAGQQYKGARSGTTHPRKTRKTLHDRSGERRGGLSVGGRTS